MTAALLNWPQATFASKIEAKDGVLTVTREIDGGLETIQVNLPTVISADLRLNEPRYATLPNIMVHKFNGRFYHFIARLVLLLVFLNVFLNPIQKAKKKPIKKMVPKDLGVDISPRIQVVSVQDPPVRKAGAKVENVDTVIEKLKALGHA